MMKMGLDDISQSFIFVYYATVGITAPQDDASSAVEALLGLHKSEVYADLITCVCHRLPCPTPSACMLFRRFRPTLQSATTMAAAQLHQSPEEWKRPLTGADRFVAKNMIISNALRNLVPGEPTRVDSTWTLWRYRRGVRDLSKLSA